MTDKILIDRAVVEQALMYLGDEAPLCSGCVYEWTQAIKVLRAALEQPQVEQEPTPNGATHKQPKQGAFYKRVDGKWYVWSRMESDKPHRWYISPGTTESCLEPLYTHPQPPRQPLTEEQIAQAVRWLYQDHRAAEMGLQDDIAVARAIERAHGIGGEA